MEKVINFCNHSLELFEGFYESGLWNSDTIINETSSDPEPPAGYEWDIDDFRAYCYEVGQKAADLIEDVTVFQSDLPIISKIEYLGIISPRFYNFETDKLHLLVTVDYDNLKRYCYETRAEDFDRYLRDNFTSCDEFISFIPNNLKDFMKEEEDERKDNVMLEYYILEEMKKYQNWDEPLDWYNEELWTYASNCFYEHQCLYKDGKYYYYSIEDEEKVKVLDEIKKEDEDANS